MECNDLTFRQIDTTFPVYICGNEVIDLLADL